MIDEIPSNFFTKLPSERMTSAVVFPGKIMSVIVCIFSMKTRNVEYENPYDSTRSLFSLLSVILDNINEFKALIKVTMSESSRKNLESFSELSSWTRIESIWITNDMYVAIKFAYGLSFFSNVSRNLRTEAA